MFNHDLSNVKEVALKLGFQPEWLDYQAAIQSQLTKHIQSKHEGVRYACDQCDFQGTAKASLKRHIHVKHEGVTIACDQCEYQATRQGHLIRHIQSKHRGIKQKYQ